MKRMVAFILIIFSLFCIVIFKDNLVISNDYEKMVIISSNDRLNLHCKILQNGDDFYYFIDNNKNNIQKLLNDNDIKGIVLYFSKDFNLNYFNNKLDYTLSKESIVGGRKVYYGYDKDYSDYRFVDNKKINVQLVYDGNQWIMGYPMILTGF